MPPSRIHDTAHVQRAVLGHAFTDAKDWAFGIEKLSELTDVEIERLAHHGAVPATRAADAPAQGRMNTGKTRLAAPASKSRT